MVEPLNKEPVSGPPLPCREASKGQRIYPQLAPLYEGQRICPQLVPCREALKDKGSIPNLLHCMKDKESVPNLSLVERLYCVRNKGPAPNLSLVERLFLFITSCAFPHHLCGQAFWSKSASWLTSNRISILWLSRKYTMRFGRFFSCSCPY